MTTPLRNGAFPQSAVGLSRRDWLAASALGFGQLALQGMLADEVQAAGGEPLATRTSHFPATARQVIFVFMHGGISHVDSFDPKPKLTEVRVCPHGESAGLSLEVPEARPEWTRSE
jgi:hypothetical protein